MVAVVDYGVGNLFSLCSSLRAIGAEAVSTVRNRGLFAKKKRNSAILRKLFKCYISNIDFFHFEIHLTNSNINKFQTTNNVFALC